MRLVTSILIITCYALAGCAVFTPSMGRQKTAPPESITLTIEPEGTDTNSQKVSIKLTFRNVSERDVYFPKHFRGGVTYYREVRTEIDFDIDTDDEALIENGVEVTEEIVEHGRGMARMMTSRGCGGRGSETEDDFVLLKPGDTYSQKTIVHTSDLERPYAIQISRALHSSAVSLPNMWLGNVKSNELLFE